MRLPAELNNGTRLIILAKNLIIDDMGISGTFAAEGPLPLEKGEIGGWAFSIDKVELDFIANTVTAGGSGAVFALQPEKAECACSHRLQAF